MSADREGNNGGAGRDWGRPCCTVLVVEDDDAMRSTCQQLLRRDGWEVAAVADAEAALAWLDERDRQCIVLTDVRMPGMDGLELLDEIHRRNQATRVVVMTAYGTIDNAVDAMRRGAADYVTKPFNKDELLLALRRVARMSNLEARIEELEEGLEERYRFAGFVARSPAAKAVVQRLRSAARSTANVLLSGESGTGKDLAARTVHFASRRASAPFVPVNCAGLPGELIESELFGHERGAYTGATERGEGLIRRADGGTLLLDEIAEMPPATQAKLLRVLQDKRVRPVGATREVEVDVRVIAATNRDIGETLESGRLREDLYYRLGVLTIHLPPLRERVEDLLPLLRLFVDRENEGRPPGQRIDSIDPQAIEVLQDHPWPGNVRELENLVERCFALGIHGELTAEDVRRELGTHPLVRASDATEGETTKASVNGSGSEPAAEVKPGDASDEDVPVDDVPSLEEVERRTIRQALAATGNNKAAAARRLGIARKTLYEKLRKYGLGDQQES